MPFKTLQEGPKIRFFHYYFSTAVMSPLTSLSLNPFRCNVCPANKQQSEKANKMLTGIGCYLYTLSAFDMV